MTFPSLHYNEKKYNNDFYDINYSNILQFRVLFSNVAFKCVYRKT